MLVPNIFVLVIGFVVTAHLTLFFSVVCIAGDTPAGEYTDYPEEIRRILKRGQLQVAMYYKNNSPYFMVDNSGHFTGWDVDMAHDIASKLGVTVSFDRSSQTYAEVVDTVAQGKVDIGISQLSRTLPRAMRVLFTKPYLILKVGLLINRIQLEKLHIRKESGLIENLNTPQCVVALRDGTSHIHYAKKLFPKAVIKTYSDWEPEAVEAVIRGDATVGITDETGLKEYLMSRPEAAIHVKTAIVDYLNDYIAMALPPKSYALKEWLDIYIEENVPELNADILLKRYSLGETANETNGFK